MVQLKGTIYIRDNAWYRMENVVKMGISSFVKNRSNTYITGEVERGEYIYIIEIPLEKMKILDKCLKSYFKSYHVYKGGGTEFYNRCIIDLIEPYLQQINIDYKIYTTEEINLINGCERLRNIPNVNAVKQIFNHLNVNDIIQKYKIKKMSMSSESFYCKDCHTKFKRKQNYEYHINTKKHKNRLSKNENLHSCSKCNKSFSHSSSLSRHRLTCKYQSVQPPILAELDTLQKENDELRKEIEQLKNGQKNITNNNTTNNNIDTQNIININCFRNENMDYITDKVILQCISKVYGSIPMILERIHFDPEHPENNNVKIPTTCTDYDR